MIPERLCRGDCDAAHYWSELREGAPWFYCKGKPAPCPAMRLRKERV